MTLELLASTDLQSYYADLISQGSWWTPVLVFVGGVIAGLSPCVYPVLPLVMGYLAATVSKKEQTSEQKSATFLASLVMVLGMALVYAIAGVILIASGSQLGRLFSNGWLMFAVAMFFIVMALFMLDVFTFPTLHLGEKLEQKFGRKVRGYPGAFLTGCVSGLMVGPCTGPIVSAVLGVVLLATSTGSEGTNWGDILYAGFLLFIFGIGQGILILACGCFAGLLQRLPRAGGWLIKLQKVFALIILVSACFLLVYVGQSTNFPHIITWLSRGSVQVNTNVKYDETKPRFTDQFLSD